MKKITAVCLGMLVLVVMNGWTVKPHKWEVRTIGQVLQGKLDGVSVSSDGVLSLAPREEDINGPSEEFYLSVLTDSSGNLFLGTGHSGKIYRIGRDEKAELYFQVPEMDVTCLALDAKGDLYAGTSPNGKVYKVTEKSKGDVFFNPREKYIWDLFFSSKGVLLAAVGESGGIYEINDSGEGRPILSAKENHFRCLVRGSNGKIWAGTGGEGRVYEISADNKASVLFETPFEEVKSIVQDNRGNIYAAASGKPEKGKEESSGGIQTQAGITVSVSAGSGENVSSPGSSSKEQAGPGALYKISPDGLAEMVWHSSDEMIYSLFWNESEKRVVFGTGKEGRIYSLGEDRKVSLLMQKDSEQVFSLYPFRDRVTIVTNNPARLSFLYPEGRTSGVYVSRVHDCGILSTWGRMDWNVETPEGTLLQFQTRSGNSSDPDQSWSEWSPPYQKTEGEQILSPRARFVQFRVLLKAESGRVTPLVKNTVLYFLQSNVRPEVSELNVFPPNVVFIKPPVQEDVIWGQALDSSEMARSSNKSSSLVSAKKTEKMGFQTLTWDARDDNGDDLVYSIEIKGENGEKWRILKEKWTEKIFAFDTRLYADGRYYLRVKASDSPSNPQGNELSAEKTSRPLVLDNSMPEVTHFGVVRRENKMTVTFQAEDRFSVIKEIQYLIRPGEWRVIFPQDGICDSKRETVKLEINLRPGWDNVITVKVEDAQGNLGVFRRVY